MTGKGSNPRPFSVDRKTFDNNWDRIFNKKPEPNATEVVHTNKSSSGEQQEKNNDKEN